jgi:aryl-alcohol dehydrogenase-like predicted oxidoreductase
MRIKRREFIQKSALSIGSVVLGARFARAVEAKVEYFDPYEKVALGKTGLKFSRFCMGTGVRGGNRQSNHTRMGKEQLERLLNDGFDRGVRWFDLADLYGTHPYLIPALKTIPRDKYGIVSKIWFQSGGIPETERPDADVVIARFLKELGTDYIDLVLLHCVTSSKWNVELQKQMEIMAKLKQKGTIRAHGVSCHSVEALEAAAAEPWVDSVHARINPYGMSMDDKPEKVVPVLKKIHDAGKGVVGMKIIGEGKLRSEPEKIDNSAKFVLGLGCVDILNVGFEKTAEIDDFAARVRSVAKTA